MCYAIVINLDHANHTDEVCLEIWESIKDGMIKAGFHLMGRNFSINLPESEAAKLARETIEGLEEHLEFHQKHIYSYIKEFYGYDMLCTTNLMVPPTEAIEVEEELEPTE